MILLLVQVLLQRSHLFGAQVAGIIFSHEIILRHFSIRHLLQFSLSSVSASIISKEMNIMTPVLKMDEITFQLFVAVPGLLIIGIFSSIIAVIFMRTLLISNKISNNSRIDFMYRPMIPEYFVGYLF